MISETSTAVSARRFDQVLCNRANKHIEETGMAVAQIAKMCGVSSSALSKFLNEKPEGDFGALQSRLEDVLCRMKDKRLLEVELFESKISHVMEGGFKTILNANDMGFMGCVGGGGKTCGCHVYLRKNPTTILCTASEWSRSGPHMRKQIWDQIQTRGWNQGKGTKAEWLIGKFKGSGRLFIVDECHELGKSGRKFWRHFHDHTGCPVAYIGNPEEFLPKLAEDSQHYSRLGYMKILEPDTTDATARGIVESFAPGKWGQVGDLALQVIAKGGHGRALRKQITLALEIHEKKDEPLRKCFLAAHERLVRDYKLKA